MCGRSGGPNNIDRRELARAMVKKRIAHDAQRGGDGGGKSGWGGGRGAGKGGRADRGWMLLSGGGKLGSE